MLRTPYQTPQASAYEAEVNSLRLASELRISNLNRQIQVEQERLFMQQTEDYLYQQSLHQRLLWEENHRKMQQEQHFHQQQLLQQELHQSALQQEAMSNAHNRLLHEHQPHQDGGREAPIELDLNTEPTPQVPQQHQLETHINNSREMEHYQIQESQNVRPQNQPTPQVQHQHQLATHIINSRSMEHHPIRASQKVRPQIDNRKQDKQVRKKRSHSQDLQDNQTRKKAKKRPKPAPTPQEQKQAIELLKPSTTLTVLEQNRELLKRQKAAPKMQKKKREKALTEQQIQAIEFLQMQKKAREDLKQGARRRSKTAATEKKSITLTQGERSKSNPPATKPRMQSKSPKQQEEQLKQQKQQATKPRKKQLKKVVKKAAGPKKTPESGSYLPWREKPNLACNSLVDGYWIDGLVAIENQKALGNIAPISAKIQDDDDLFLVPEDGLWV